ncbi:hypothetical protein VPHD81_0055 [Vibrio phage D81]
MKSSNEIIKNDSVDWFLVRPTIGYPEFQIPPLCGIMDIKKGELTISDIQIWFNATSELIYRAQQAAKQAEYQAQH